MPANIFHKAKFHFRERPLIKHRLCCMRKKSLIFKVKNNNTNRTFNKNNSLIWRVNKLNL